MDVVWSEDARQDLLRIVSYLVREAPVYASGIVDRIEAAALSLSQFPDRFRPGAREGTRELVVRGLPYIVVYSVQEEFVEIIAVFHAAQDIPRGG